eukprot:TRINITY_DN67746_c6_g18_i2.p1 TRINITY_DN67746_c6_g18~~TRINITY_DN67746_c6_g18_i2.p1  ORF type:complete len:308 (-),score=-8.31 TRINITY_DN67746_c6_g18_i2:111-1034(-)
MLIMHNYSTPISLRVAPVPLGETKSSSVAAIIHNSATNLSGNRIIKDTGFILVGIFVIFLQIAWSIAFGTQIFPRGSRGVQVIFCALYPVAVMLIKSLMRPFMLHSGCTRLFIAISQVAAAFPYRFLFPMLISDGALFASILAVELTFKTVLYGLPLSRRFWRIINNLIDKSETLRQKAKAIPDPDNLEPKHIELAEKFFFHQLTDGMSAITLLLGWSVARWVERDASLANHFTDSQYRTLVILYAIGAVFEVVLTVVFLAVVHFGGLAAAFRARIAFALTSMAAIPLIAALVYVVVFGYTSTYQFV